MTALKDFNAQLMSTYGWSSAQAYAHEGFSGMDGRTDTGEYFYQSDFATGARGSPGNFQMPGSCG